MSAVPLLRKTLRAIGVDQAVAYTLLGRGWSVLAGPVTLIFIIRFLSPQEQGFYYTFGSILGLQVFLELGLSGALILYSSHEKAKLDWTAQGSLTGDPIAKCRLSTLLRTALIWYGVVALLFVLIVLPVGWHFFQTHQPPGARINWPLPWIWAVLVQAAGLLLSPLFAILEGCGLISEIALLRLFQSITGWSTCWIILYARWGLYAAPVFNTVSLLAGLAWLIAAKRIFLVDLLTQNHLPTALNWGREVWPFQWKFALSNVSGYFAFALFNPVLFAYHGATAAGQLGMSSNIMGALSAMAMAWVSTKASPFGMLIAKREFEKFDRLFFPALWQSLALIVLGGIVFWSAAYYFHSIHHRFGSRLLDPLPLGLLIATMVLSHIIGAEAIYLRAHKQEPFLIISIAIGVLVALCTYVLGKPYAATGMMVGFFLVNLIFGVGGGTWIFVTKRRLWHLPLPVSEPTMNMAIVE